MDSSGRAVALNAGGSNNSSASYYLPLHAVVRALDALKAGVEPPRGTLRVVWRHLTCDEIRRFGVNDATEGELRAYHARHRDPLTAVGLLAVEQVVRGGRGEAAGLAEGDLLVELGPHKFPDFDGLEAFLDACQNTPFDLVVERAGTVSYTHLTLPTILLV